MSAAETYTIFDEVTRKCVGKITCAPERLAAQIQKGQIAIAGCFDRTTAVLGDDGKPVHDAQRASDHDRQRQRDARIARMTELERKQHRRVRELLLSADPQLQAIDAEISNLRKVINDADKT